MDNEDNLEWWGYIHIDGTLHIKRYYTQTQILDALESDFVKFISGRVYAKDKAEATKLIQEDLDD
jgi:hypothetical protein